MRKGAYGARGNSRLAARGRNGPRQPGAEDGGRRESVVRSAARHGSVSGGFSRARERLNRPARASTEPWKHGPPHRMKCRTGTRQPATARGDGTNRPAIRGRGSLHREVWVNRRRHVSFDPRLERGSVQHFAARTSVRSPWRARGATDRRV